MRRQRAPWLLAQAVYHRVMLAHVDLDARVLVPAPRQPEQPLRVVVLMRRSWSDKPLTEGILWLPSEPGFGPQRQEFLRHWLENHPERSRIGLGLGALANAAGQGTIELGVIVEDEAALLEPHDNVLDDPRTRALCATLLHSASLRRPVDLVVVPHDAGAVVDDVRIGHLMAIAHRANVPVVIGVPANAVQMLQQNKVHEANRQREQAGWVALLVGDVAVDAHEEWFASGFYDEPGGTSAVSAVFALATTVIASAVRNDFPNFIGQTTGGRAEGFYALVDMPTAAKVFADDGWIADAAAGFVPLRAASDGTLYFPAMPMAVHASMAQEYAGHLPWRMLVTRVLAHLRHARDELLQSHPHANADQIRDAMQDMLGTMLATHGAVISPPVRARRPFSDHSCVSVECTEWGDRVTLVLVPHRASTPREMVVRFQALVAR